MRGRFAVVGEDDRVSTNNPQAVDVAYLNRQSSVLVVDFGLKIFRESGNRGASISACNLAGFEQSIRALNDAYAQAGGFSYLAELYVERIASGAWLWRNRFGSDLKVTVKARLDGQPAGEFVFTEAVADLKPLASLVEKGLLGEGVVDLFVSGQIDIGVGQQVYPSQEMATNADASRVYYCNEKSEAMMHSQKIGNALRTIDIWHDSYDMVGALPVEPYGSSIRRQDAYRYESRSFYTLIDQVLSGQGPILDILKARTLSDLDRIQDSHYFMAMLVRGGVFGGSKSTKGDDA